MEWNTRLVVGFILGRQIEEYLKVWILSAIIVCLNPWLIGFKFVVLIDHAKEKVNGAVGHSSIIYEMEVSAQLLLPENWIPILFLTKEGRPSAQLSSAQGFKP